MLDTNVVFRLEGETRLHPRARRQRSTCCTARAGRRRPLTALCLVTRHGRAPSQRLHPTIKGVEGAQSRALARLLQPRRLYLLRQGAGRQRAHLRGRSLPLRRRAEPHAGPRQPQPAVASGRRRHRRVLGRHVRQSDEARRHSAAEDVVRHLDAEPPDDDDTEAPSCGRCSGQARRKAGRSQTPARRCEPGTRFHVLGLAPNAARLSSATGSTTVSTLSRSVWRAPRRPAPRAARPGRRSRPSVSRLLVRTTALQEKFENIPPLLAGEVMRAVLSGTPIRARWLAAALIRLRAGDDPPPAGTRPSSAPC